MNNFFLGMNPAANPMPSREGGRGATPTLIATPSGYLYKCLIISAKNSTINMVANTIR